MVLGPSGIWLEIMCSPPLAYCLYPSGWLRMHLTLPPCSATMKSVTLISTFAERPSEFLTVDA